ncbi:MAG TPA: HAD hydrolase-like protein [Candidatus Saccharimonadales bacterium]|nr:HAD hydrolase-like protein [Candidatus Saccharimonadales bacterium]
MSTLIFDFDGTLADSFELVVEVAHELTGVRMRTPEEIAELRRLPLLTAIHRMGVSWWMVPRLWAIFRKRMYSRMHEVKPFPGVPTLLSDLHKEGHHLLVMSSNREQNVRACLRAHNLEHYFGGVYHGSVFNKARALRLILRRNKQLPETAYYIGNEILDVAAAHKVGMQAIAVTWGGNDREALELAKPDLLADKPQAIRELFVDGTV